MTRHTATHRRSKVRLVLEARTTRDESSGYRHKWTTTATFGLLTASGPNTREAVEKLLAQLTALAHSQAAEEALARETHGRMEIFRAEVETHGAGVAELRLRARQRGEDPDRPVVTE